MNLTPGLRLGPYQILSLLGSGGMGEVYRARDTRLGREVALKVVHSRFASDVEHLRRFEKEARAASQLDHPNILVVHDVGTYEGSPYIVSELLQGESLREKLGSHVPPGKAIEYALQVARGLAVAHEKGIVHRDIKPENLFVTKDGHVKILDFGIAKLLPTFDGSGVDTRASTEIPTQAGTAVGTVAYMSPEQAQGRSVDFRSDQFSLGVVLYEMLAGQRPFRGASAAETLAAILREEPEPVTKLEPKVPAILGWIVQRCLSKDPEERYSSTRDLAKELQSLLAHLSEAVNSKNLDPDKASNSRRRISVWMLSGVGGLTVLFGLLVVTGVMRRGSLPASPLRLSLSLPLEAAPQDTGNFNPLALSPDGKILVYAGSQLFIRSLEREEIKPIAGTDGGASPFFSPDGRWIGFFADGKLKKVPLDGGPPITLCNIKEPGGGGYGAGSWGADGSIVFMPGYFSGLQRISASGGKSRALTTVDAAALESHTFPQILPDGQHVLFEIEKVAPNSVPQAAVVSLRTGQPRVVAEDAAYPRYIPTGHLIFTRGGSLLAMPFSLKRLQVFGLAVPMVEDLLTNRRYTNAANIAVSSNGTLVYVSREQFRRALVWVDRRGVLELLPFPPAFYSEVALSPDGARFAALAVEKDESIRLLIGDFARGTLTLAPAEGFFQHLAWTPDDKRIALDFCATALDLGRLNWVSADGSTPLESMTNEAARQHETPTSFSPDGKVLLFDVLSLVNSGASDAGSDIFVLPLNGDRRAKPFLQTRFDEKNASFSPDGRWVAYQSNEPGRFEVFVRPFPGPGPKWQISAEGGTRASWSRDGRQLFYRNGDKMMAVGIETTPALRAGKPLTLFEGQFLESYDADLDGKRFLMIKKDPVESGPARVNVVLNWFDEVKRRAPAGN
jgi:eukaryotic-like serine/threonine-protein kinase